MTKREKEARKAVKLFERVIALQEEAPAGTHYSFDFAGCVDGVEFRKTNARHETVYSYMHYLGETHGDTLKKIEEAIAKEEAIYETV